jgi:hypothetical protein
MKSHKSQKNMSSEGLLFYTFSVLSDSLACALFSRETTSYPGKDEDLMQHHGIFVSPHENLNREMT